MLDRSFKVIWWMLQLVSTLSAMIYLNCLNATSINIKNEITDDNFWWEQ